MAMFNDKTKDKLNELLEKAYDAEKGFKKVAQHVENPRLKTFFNQKALERSGYINELSSALRTQGMEVSEKDGSVSGSIHRAWIDTKALFSIDNDESMLEEVKTGEKAAIEDYEDILNNYEISLPVRDTLIKQKDAIQASYNKADYLEDIH
ncbi:PA2169 family four-helix-bundle protein [Bizionia gelidisalsuginis]|uniref:PA2169 family four-helix-bundle protein n=2 Tax=Bizionia TaxID=283785 RepID=A0A8H2LKD8_9FLAO|nr:MULTISPECIES: PA2169 family four-helix-bundle protein [Bizionia]TYB71529.1 PA2169 family four-helix-bundle protein [Bizionia saleffrena]TYC10750.1 PA2169 family four-helix-bundle protein [Bizionia gelidisalsuginis]